jgi:hypothetical protein
MQKSGHASLNLSLYVFRSGIRSWFSYWKTALAQCFTHDVRTVVQISPVTVSLAVVPPLLNRILVQSVNLDDDRVFSFFLSVMIVIGRQPGRDVVYVRKGILRNIATRPV